MLTLGYWNLRGFAEPIRLLLQYLKLDYKEDLFNQNEEWFDNGKKQLKTNFPNLPYLIDGDFVVTESLVIPSYLIKKEKKYELLGQNSDGSFNTNEIIVQQLLHGMKDLRDTVYMASQIPTFKQEKQILFTEKYNVQLDKLQRQLSNKEYLVDNLTYADFYLYDLLRQLKFLNPNFNYLPEFMERFERIPEIRKYLDTKENKIYILESMKDKFFI